MSNDDLDAVNRQAKQDLKKVKRIGRGETPGMGRVMESIFWAVAAVFGVFMMVSMPFVGPEKLIGGTAWLLVSLGGIAVFGGLAMVTRQLPEV